MSLRSLALSCVLVLLGSTAAFAQQSTSTSSWDLGVSAAHIDYDLSGTGTAAGLAVRATRHLTPAVSLEIRGLYAKPEQQFGPSTLFAPDVQLQYRWNIARFSPYVGGGVGFATLTKPLHTDWDPTTSVAVGTTVRLTDRVGVTGELRLRGFEWKWAGSTAEWSAGLTWGLPAF
jgi:opacity protein-like surface antigen